MKYNAFISYNQKSDNDSAVYLQRSLHRFAKPWYKKRSLRIFRDKTTLAVEPRLRKAIESALDSSEYLMLIASPNSAKSQWVSREIQYWIDHRSIDSLIIVLVGGELKWDDDNNDFVWDNNTPLPTNLKGKFRGEPIYLDLANLQNIDQMSLNNPLYYTAVASIASTLHHKDKDEISGEDIRQHRNTKRVITSAISLLLLLLIIVTIVAVFAVFQKRQAQKRLAYSLLKQSQSALASVKMKNAKKLLADSENLFNEIEESSKELAFSKWDIYSRAPLPLNIFSTQSRINGIFILKDDMTLLTGEDDGYIRFWDLKTGLIIKEHRTPSTKLTAIAVTQEEDKLLTGNIDGELMLWGIRPWRLIKQWKGHDYPINNIVITPDGQRAVSAGSRGNLIGENKGDIICWNLYDGSRIHNFNDFNRGASSLSCSPDGKYIVGGGFSGELLLWSTKTGQVAWRMQVPDFPMVQLYNAKAISSTAYSPDGKFILVGHLDGTLTLWNTNLKTEKKLPIPHNAPILALSISKDNVGYSGGADEIAISWSLEDNSRLLHFSDHNAAVSAIDCSSDGNFIVSGDITGKVIVWLTHKKHEGIYEFKAGLLHTTSLAISSDERLLLTGSSEGIMHLLDINTGQSLASFPSIMKPGVFLKSVSFTNDQKNAVGVYIETDEKALSFSKSNKLSIDLQKVIKSIQIIVWDITTGKIVFTKSGSPLGRFIPSGFGLSSNGDFAFVVDSNSEVSVWKLPNGNLCAKGKLQEEMKRQIAMASLSPDGKSLILTDFDDNTTLWDIETNKTLQKFDNIKSFLKVSQDNLWSVISNNKNESFLWDIQQKVKRMRVNNEFSTTTAVDFSTNQKLLWHAGTDGTISVWDMIDDFNLYNFNFGSINSMCSSKDGNLLGYSKKGSNTAVLIDFLKPQTNFSALKRTMEINQILKRDPEDINAKAELGNYYVSRHMWSWGRTLLQDAKNRESTKISLLNLAQCFWMMNELPVAWDTLRTALEKNEIPSSYIRICLRAIENLIVNKLRDTYLDIIRSAGQIQTSEQLVELANRIPDDAPPYALGLKLIALKDLYNSRIYLSNLDKNEVNLGDIYLSMGILEAFSGDHKKAANWFQKNVDLDGNDPVNLNLLFMTLYRAGDNEHAISICNSIIENSYRINKNLYIPYANVLDTCSLLMRKIGYTSNLAIIKERSNALVTSTNRKSEIHIEMGSKNLIDRDALHKLARFPEVSLNAELSVRWNGHNLLWGSLSKYELNREIGLLETELNKPNIRPEIYFNIAQLYDEEKRKDKAALMYKKYLELIEYRNLSTAVDVELIQKVGLSLFNSDQSDKAIELLIKHLPKDVSGYKLASLLAYIKLSQGLFKINSKEWGRLRSEKNYYSVSPGPSNETIEDATKLIYDAFQITENLVKTDMISLEYCIKLYLLTRNIRELLKGINEKSESIISESNIEQLLSNIENKLMYLLRSNPEKIRELGFCTALIATEKIREAAKASSELQETTTVKLTEEFHVYLKYAVRNLEQSAMSDNYKKADALVSLSYLYYILGHLEVSEQNARIAITIDSSNKFAVNLFVGALIAQEKESHIEEFLIKWLENHEDVNLKLVLAKIFVKTHRYFKAIDYIKDVLAFDPENITGNLAIASIFLSQETDQNSLQFAGRHLDQLKKISRRQFSQRQVLEYQMLIGIYQAFIGRLHAAEEQFKVIINENPYNTDALSALKAIAKDDPM